MPDLMPPLSEEELEQRCSAYLARAEKAETENVRLRSEIAVANENIGGYRSDLAAARAEIVELTSSIQHIHDWIHSGDRETDTLLQAEQWGRDVCEWLPEYATRLRAEIEANYERRKPAAWFAARALVAPAEGQGRGEPTDAATPPSSDLLRAAQSVIADTSGNAGLNGTATHILVERERIERLAAAVDAAEGRGE